MRVLIVLGLIGSIFAAPFDERIVGGGIAGPGQYPYQVSLRIDNEHICGGSIINANTILTAAHCLYRMNTGAMTVVVGTNSLISGGTTYSVSSVQYHEEYNPHTVFNDIGIVRVSVPIQYTSVVQPIALVDYEIEDDQVLVASGWGQTADPGYPSNELKHISLNSYNNAKCREELSIIGEVNSNHICTFVGRDQGMCYGDSGGPLAYNGQLAGLASWAYPCAVGLPDVFTKVSAFIDWIQRYA